MTQSRREVATLGGGCFWCLEAAFEMLEGVAGVESGYTGGVPDHPSYEEVCSGRTGHVEVVRVAYDPDRISYPALLEVFFSIHDPTTLDRQGADVGSQYRSVVFYHNDAQRDIAESVIRRLEQEGIWRDPIVTAVESAPPFFPAEEYHRDYYRRNPEQAYCRVVIAPKLAKLRKVHAERLMGTQPTQDRASDTAVRGFQSEPRNALDQGGIAD